MKIIPVSCPKCGASFEIDEGRKTCFCQYCGTQIFIDDGTVNAKIEQNINYRGEHTSVFKDEARLKELEIEKIKAEHEIKEAARNRKITTIRTIVIIIWVVLLFITLGFDRLSATLYLDYKIKLDYRIEQILGVLCVIIPIILLLTRRRKK